MNIVVSGSLAYDRIMDFPGHFADHILPEKIHVLNVCFQVNGMREQVGGTAGNIAYALKLMGQEPAITATIGRDYRRYFDWLAAHGISSRGIRIIQEEFTAGAFITTDQSDNQITGFNPGAMRFSSDLGFDAIDAPNTIMIVAPGNLDDMREYPRECRNRGIRYIFDPGQSLPTWNPEELVRAIDGSMLLISNDYELELIMSKTGLNRESLLTRTGAIITTLGEAGSQVATPGVQIPIPTVPPRQVVDPTGAGDSYRAGLLAGLALGLDIKKCALMGSVCASFAVECYGTQEYAFTPGEFDDRLSRCSC